MLEMPTWSKITVSIASLWGLLVPAPSMPTQPEVLLVCFTYSAYRLEDI